MCLYVRVPFFFFDFLRMVVSLIYFFFTLKFFALQRLETNKHKDV